MFYIWLTIETFIGMTRISLFLIFISFSLFVSANDSKSGSNVVKPRVFGEKIYVTTEAGNAEKYNLVLFTADGEQVIVKQIEFEDGEFVYPTTKLEAGVYTYFIRNNEDLIARGTFTKN